MINRYMARLIDELRADDIPDPLRERVMLAAVWDDLCRHSGEAPPPHVRLALEDLARGDQAAADAAPVPEGSAAADWRPGATPAREEVDDDTSR